MANPPWLLTLHKAFTTNDWPKVAELAIEAHGLAPERGEPYWYASHALRQLGRLEEGFDWAARGLVVAPDDLLVLSRYSLLANLTSRFELAFDAAKRHASRPVTTEQDRYNLGVLITNGIHAASKLGRIPEAVKTFEDAIERVDVDTLHFNAACLFALAGDERGFDSMEKSLASGKPVADFADADFDSLRSDARFQRLLERDWVRERAAHERAKNANTTLRIEHFVDVEQMDLVAEVPLADTTEFERALALAPTKPASWQVLIDFLLERDDVRGTLWQLWNAAQAPDFAKAEDRSARMIAACAWAKTIEQHAGSLVGPAARWWRHAGFHGGFISSLKVYTAASSLDDLERALAHSSCRFLQRLEVRDLFGEDQVDYGQAVDIVAAADLPLLTELRVEPDSETRSRTELITEKLGEKFPRLRSLELGGGIMGLGTLDLPRLERFAVRSGGLMHHAYASIAAAQWPKLTHLEIWFGTEEYGDDAFEATHVAELLTGRTLPVLTSLGLMNAEFTDGLISVLRRSELLPRLSELDLSMGTLSDSGASEILSHAKAFEHLKRFDVSRNCLSPEWALRLKERFDADVSKQKPDRYVSVSE